MTVEDVKTETLEWNTRVPIFRNRTIVTQLGIAIGIPFGILALVLFLVSDSPDRWYALAVIGGLLFLTFLFVQVVYGGKYDVAYVLDDKGVLSYTQAGQAKKNRIINGLTVVLGLFSRQPSAAGAGMLAASRQRVFLGWGNVQKVQYLPKQRTIMVRGSVLEPIALFCTPENYAQAEELVRQHTGR